MIDALPEWAKLALYLVGCIIVLAIISGALIRVYSWASTSDNYFDKLSFGSANEDTVSKAVAGILQGRKAEPFYVHAAPTGKEFQAVVLELATTGFAKIRGGPGEGKSLLAYHVAHELQVNERYEIYSLDTSTLESRSGNEVRNELLHQLDNLQARRKLVIADDAHRLQMRRDLRLSLHREAEEGNGKFIWIETEFFEEARDESGPEAEVGIDFASLLDELLRGFYESRAPHLRKALEGRIEGLDEAIESATKKEIRDAWHFAFVTSRGEEGLSEEVKTLSNLELVVLFVISAFTVLSGESEMSVPDLLNKLHQLRFGWLTEELRISSFHDAIIGLQKQTARRRSMIKIYNKRINDGSFVSSLHYNFARAAIRTSLLRTGCAADIVQSITGLLTSDYRTSSYVAVLIRDLGEYAGQFVRQNEEWFIGFTSNPLSDRLVAYHSLLMTLKQINTDVLDKLVTKLNIKSMAAAVSTAKASQFTHIAGLLTALGSRRKELILKMDLTLLARAAGVATAEQFQHVVGLLRAMGDQGDSLVEQLIADDSVRTLAKTISTVHPDRFQDTANLLKSFGLKSAPLLSIIDYDELIHNAKETRYANDFRGLTLLMVRLDEKHREKFVENLDWPLLVTRCPIEAGLLRALGGCLEGAWRHAEITDDKDALNKVVNYLRNNKTELIQQIKLAYELVRKNFRVYNTLYAGVGKFLWNCNRLDKGLALEIAESTLGDLIGSFHIAPTNYLYVGQLVNAFCDINPDLSGSFLWKHNIKGRIQHSLNIHNWRAHMEGTRHLIRAFYRSAPKLWKITIEEGWITADLTTLDLESIYKEVDEPQHIT